jgi:hypothetical protein
MFPPIDPKTTAKMNDPLTVKEELKDRALVGARRVGSLKFRGGLDPIDKKGRERAFFRLS